MIPEFYYATALHHTVGSILELNGKTIFTDGHTRAYVLFKLGMEKIRCIWDSDNLDRELYQNCVEWCFNEGISNISHLSKISHEEYKVLWYHRCEKLMKELREKR